MIRINLIPLTPDEKRRADRRTYYRTHPEIWGEARRKEKERYAADPKYRRHRLDSQRRYADANPEKRKEKDKKTKATRRSQPWGKLDYILRNAKARARKRNQSFDDALFALTKAPPTVCDCCGVALVYVQGQGQNPRSPSLDRVDSTKGYTVENVVVICMRCNAIKNNGTADEHRTIAAYIDRHLQAPPPDL